MLTGEIRNQIDRIWDAFWAGGIANPLEVIEQITYLLFIRRLDDLHTLEENKANRLKKPIERRVFPEGKDARGRPYEDFRWSRFKNFAPAEMFTVVGEHVFPFLRTLGGDESTYAHHMKDARFTIPIPALLARVVDMIDHVPMEDRDTKGDLYEYMLGKIASAGMLRIGSMNMLLHGVENPDIRYRDSLAQDHAGEEEKYTLVLANPPFAGSLDYENCAKDLQQIVKTKKTELLFLALFLRPASDGGGGAEDGAERVAGGAGRALRHPPAPRLPRRTLNHHERRPQSCIVSGLRCVRETASRI
jgi:type I restriction-modification system DNA methylase subunit